MKYYVVADIHGYFTLFKKSLTEAGFFEETEPCKLVVCGDLLDRGNEARELVEFMLERMNEGRLIYVRGNHEDLFIQCLQQIAGGGAYDIANGMSHHYINRTWHSMLQLSEMTFREACSCPNELIRRIRRSDFYTKLLPSCVDYYETPRYIFTHGWIPCYTKGLRSFLQYEYNEEWRNAGFEEWSAARWFNGMEVACRFHITEPNKTIVCGHKSASYGHARINHSCTEWGEDAIFSPFRAEGILAIDASTANSEIVNCVVIED